MRGASPHLQARDAAAAAQQLDGVDVRGLELVALQQALQRGGGALPEAGLECEAATVFCSVSVREIHVCVCVCACAIL